jgi:hypothetical protein
MKMCISSVMVLQNEDMHIKCDSSSVWSVKLKGSSLGFCEMDLTWLNTLFMKLAQGLNHETILLLELKPKPWK